MICVFDDYTSTVPFRTRPRVCKMRSGNLYYTYQGTGIRQEKNVFVILIVLIDILNDRDFFFSPARLLRVTVLQMYPINVA